MIGAVDELITLHKESLEKMKKLEEQVDIIYKIICQDEQTKTKSLTKGDNLGADIPRRDNL